MQGEKVLADMEDKGQNPLNSLVGSKVFTSFQSDGDVFIAYISASTSSPIAPMCGVAWGRLGAARDEIYI